MKVIREIEAGWRVIVYRVGQYGETLQNEKPVWEGRIFDTRDEAIKAIDECPLVKKLPEPRKYLNCSLMRNYYATEPYTEFGVHYTEKVLRETKVEK